MRCYRPISTGVSLLLLFLAAAAISFAQSKSNSPNDPDVLIFSNGEKLIGQLERSTGSSVVFKSDSVGEITVDWSKVKELHTSRDFAVIGKGVKLRHNDDVSSVPQGSVSVTNSQVQVNPSAQAGPPKTVPVPDAAYMIDEQTFRKNMVSTPGFFQNWAGAVTAGASIVQATQRNRNFTGAVSLVRTVPDQNWLDPRYRTTIDFSQSYGKVSQSGTPTVKTNIIHAGVEHDHYLTSRVFAFGAAAWDHNFSQGLDLQQKYGGGLGWTVLKTDLESLDLKASMVYVKQQFAISGNNQDLVGSTFGESYTRKFSRGITLAQNLAVTPAWNNTDAYSAFADLTLGLPLYKRFNLTLSAVEGFLNNPPPGFRKNSFQFIAGLTYSIP
jgi:hypothetical protein